MVFAMYIFCIIIFEVASSDKNVATSFAQKIYNIFKFYLRASLNLYLIPKFIISKFQYRIIINTNVSLNIIIERKCYTI